jgi:DNA-binding LacI/PurR family transcriptional regulator
MGKKKETADNSVPRESPRARVLNWLKHSLESGEFPTGSEIPTARAIARQLGVAPNTAVTALTEAESQGLVVCRAGTSRRYAGELRKGGGNSLAASTVFVLATMPTFSDLATAPGWSDEFLALDVARRLSLMGRHVSLLNADSLPDGGLDAVFEARPGAMVVTNAVNGDPLAMAALARCREAGIPAVTYGNAPELRDYDRAYSDHRAGSRELTRWLLARGRRRIVPFFPFIPAKFWGRERLEGYAEAMREAGLEPLPAKTFSLWGIQAETPAEHFRVHEALAVSALLSLRRDGGDPDALLCLTDGWAKPVLAAIRDLGLVPNRDILVAGYDNMTRGAAFDDFEIERPAVTVDKHNERSAEDIATLVAARMDGSLPPEPQARIHDHELIVLDPSCP